jgi:hypothetical protein
MNSLVKIPPYSKFNFQGKFFFIQNWCNITLMYKLWFCYILRVMVLRQHILSWPVVTVNYEHSLIIRVLFMFMLSFICGIGCGLFEWKLLFEGVILFVHIGIVVVDPIIRGGCDHINWFSLVTLLCLSQAKT